MKNLLLIHYGPGPNSVTDQIVARLKPRLEGKFNLEELDLVLNHPIFYTKESMGAFVKRNYKGEELAAAESSSLQVPDKFTDQLLRADLLVMVFPMYNFTVPAVVKGWIDNVAQAKKTFRYTEYGPVGLAEIEKAVVIPVTGSTPAKTARDFLTPYVDYILKFMGVKEVAFKGIHGTKFMGELVAEKIKEVVVETEKELA